MVWLIVAGRWESAHGESGKSSLKITFVPIINNHTP